MKRYYWCEGCGVPIHNKGRCTECRIRLHEKAVVMRKRMEAKGAKPLPDHIVDQTLRDMFRHNKTAQGRDCNAHNFTTMNQTKQRGGKKKLKCARYVSDHTGYHFHMCGNTAKWLVNNKPRCGKHARGAYAQSIRKEIK